MKPRPYQVEAKAAVYRELRVGRSTLVVAATGLGKGALIGQIVADAVRAGRRALIVVHRKEIVDQLAEHVRRWSGAEPAIEQGPRREGGPGSPVVVASVASLVRRLDRFGPDAFDLLIHDEAHHALAATHMQLLEHFATAKIVGLTATPNRGDELALAQAFESVAFDMGLDAGIREGWLVPLRVERIKLHDLDLSGVRQRHGDLMAGDLGAVMSELAVLREAIEPALELAAGKQALVFTVTRAHMHAVASAVRTIAHERRLDVPVAVVDGTTPPAERDRIFADFRSRKIRWLINVDVATEGVDVPGCEAVICLRPTLSKAVYLQQVGRGARPLPGIVDGVGDGLDPRAAARARTAAIAASAKPECLILDFAANTSRFSTVDTLELLGGDYLLPERNEAERLLELGEATHLLEALEQARVMRLGSIREARARAGDPFALFGLDDARDRYGRRPTPKHRAVLQALRTPRADLDWRQAQTIVTEVARRQREGLCLYSQAALLARRGFPIDGLAELGRRDAAALVRGLARSGWSLQSAEE